MSNAPFILYKCLLTTQRQNHPSRRVQIDDGGRMVKNANNLLARIFSAIRPGSSGRGKALPAGGNNSANPLQERPRWCTRPAGRCVQPLAASIGAINLILAFLIEAERFFFSLSLSLFLIDNTPPVCCETPGGYFLRM